MEGIATDRGCALCGDRVVLTVGPPPDRDFHYTDDLTELLDLNRGDTLLIRAECGCDRPRTVCVQGASIPTDADPF